MAHLKLVIQNQFTSVLYVGKIFCFPSLKREYQKIRISNKYQIKNKNIKLILTK